jgi:quercetin dioxygenase-like cupin family protein
MRGFETASVGVKKGDAMTTPTPRVKPWPDDLPLSAPALEERMQAEGLPYYRWSNGPGDVYPAHSHTFDKVIYVVRGDITFGLPQTGANLTLHAGDRLDLPAGIVHDAVVGGKGVVCLEGHRS